MCSCCGKPYAAIGADISPLVEIDVKAHKRVIRRPRWRRACGCASSPIEVSAPTVPRLFRNTPYGISVWWNCAPTRNRRGGTGQASTYGSARQYPTRQAASGIGDFLHPATLRRHQQEVTLLV